MPGKLKLLWYILQMILLVRALIKSGYSFKRGKGSVEKVANLLFTLWFLGRKVWIRVR